MGKCRVNNCSRQTDYKHNNGWCRIHFYLNYKAPRFYLAIITTFLLEFFLSKIGWVDEFGVLALITGSLFETTNFIPFYWLNILIILLVPIISFIGISKYLYLKLKIP